MKQKNGNTAKFLRILVVAAAILIMSGITVSADEIVYVNFPYDMPTVNISNDYDSSHNAYRFSDPSMVLVNGQPLKEKQTTYYYPCTVRFVRTGEVEITHSWTLYDGRTDGTTRGSAYTTKYIVKEREAFTGDISVTGNTTIQPSSAARRFPS